MADDGRIRVPVNGETIGEAFDKAGEDITKSATEFGQGVVETGENAINAIGDLFNNGVEAAQQFGSDLSQGFSDGAQAVGDFLSETAERNKAEAEKVMEQHDPYVRPMELS